jgi:hypothetical protein
MLVHLQYQNVDADDGHIGIGFANLDRAYFGRVGSKR